MHIEDIEYFCDEQRFVGQLAVDDTRNGARPAVLVSHEGGGLDDHAKNMPAGSPSSATRRSPSTTSATASRHRPRSGWTGSAGWPAIRA